MQRKILVLLGLHFFTQLYAGQDRLIIVSAHRKSIQQEFIPPFEADYKKRYGKPVFVEWVDHSGASNSLRFIIAKYESTPPTSGMDLLWGGGEHPHLELANKKLLLPFNLPQEIDKYIPESLGGLPLKSKDSLWHAAALSSFGIFYNKRMLSLLKLQDPQTWEDLADIKFFDALSNADPRKSSSSVTMNLIILQSLGWEKGWQFLTAIAANTRKFTMSSSDPSKAIISGEAAAGMVIDYFAFSKIVEMGHDKLGFVLPAGKTIINPDPISILKGAPNEIVAKRFVEFVMGAEAQRLLILQKGSEGGPKHSTLGRMSANRQAYEGVKDPSRLASINPFSLQFSPFVIDISQVTKMQFVFSDLLGAIHIDLHKELKEAWKAIIRRGAKAEDIAFIGAPLVTREEMVKLSEQWDKPLVRNNTLRNWEQTIRQRYALVTSGKNSN